MENHDQATKSAQNLATRLQFLENTGMIARIEGVRIATGPGGIGIKSDGNVFLDYDDVRALIHVLSAAVEIVEKGYG